MGRAVGGPTLARDGAGDAEPRRRSRRYATTSLARSRPAKRWLRPTRPAWSHHPACARLQRPLRHRPARRRPL